MIKYTFSIAVILSFIALIIVGLLNYKKYQIMITKNEKYTFLNSFPFEMQDKEQMPFNKIYRICTSLFSILFLIFGVFIFLIYQSNIIIILIQDYFMSFIFIVLGISLLFTFITDLKDLKKHLTFSTILFVSTLILYAYMAFYVFSDPRELYPLWFGWVCVFIATVLLLLILFAPLKEWAKLERVDENGTVNYKRKKFSILPFMEWLFILLDVIFIIFIMILR